MSSTTGTHFRSYPSHFVSPIPYCAVNSPKSHRHRATWQPENSHGQPVPEALFDDDQDKQGTSEGEGKEKRLQRQRNMFATYSFLYPPPSTAVLGIKLPPSIPPFLCSPLSLLRSSPFFILSRYASDTQDRGMRMRLREFRQRLWNGFRERVLCKRQKVVKNARKVGSGVFFLSPFSPTYRTSGRRRGDEFRHVRRKLGREEGQKTPEIGKAITRSDGMCALHG